jgi:hypothetical protein
VGSGQPFLCYNLPRFDRLLGTDHPCVLNQKKIRKTPMALQPSFIDHYEILQISPKAGQETIERIYRFMAKKYHPDNQATGNAEKFNLLTTAYKTLAHPEKRAAYDATYESSQETGNGNRSPRPVPPKDMNRTSTSGASSCPFFTPKKEPSPPMGAWALCNWKPSCSGPQKP